MTIEPTPTPPEAVTMAWGILIPQTILARSIHRTDRPKGRPAARLASGALGGRRLGLKASDQLRMPDQGL
jgi:hypothetical protein